MPLRELLEALLGEEGRRRLALRHKTNDELFQLYDVELVLRLHNQKNLSDTRTILGHYGEFLGGFPPSPQLAKSFLARYADKKPRTFYRYAQMVKAFQKWYGEPIDDVKVKVPKSLPPYVKPDDVGKLIEALSSKRTHKHTIERDTLLVDVAFHIGLRRSELSNLEARHVQSDFVLVREGKNNKDRVVPLPPRVAQRLHRFVADKRPEEKVFGLKAACISNKVRLFAKRAGVQLHTHALRDGYATQLAEKRANPEAIRQLLGHENLATTQRYIALVDGGLRHAVDLLEEAPALGVPRSSLPRTPGADVPREESVIEHLALKAGIVVKIGEEGPIVDRGGGRLAHRP